MTEFCTCGSIIINGQCTNKNCSYKAQSGSVQAKPKPGKKSATAKKEPKASKTKRASKCITYNLYETEIEEEIQ